MKNVCRKEKCTKETKHVNNLSVFAHTRVKIDSEIEITPFDYRFPRGLTLLVQAIHEVLWLLLMSIGIVLLIFFYILIRYAVDKNDIIQKEQKLKMKKK